MRILHIANDNWQLSNKKILFADLDGTLIETLSKETFPKGVWDMRIRLELLLVWKKVFPKLEHIYIVTNQGGIEHGYVDKQAFDAKMQYVKYAIEEYLGVKVDYAVCESNDPNNRYRKPNNGMFKRFSYKIYGGGFTNRDIVMVGDASGLPGQFSNSDLLFAQNSDIDYMDVGEFL